MFPLGCMLDIRHLSPRRKGPSMAQPIMRGFQQRALNTKEIVDGTVHREKPLGVARRFDPHLAFLLAGGLMRYFCAVVRPFFLAVGDFGQEITARCSVATELIGHQLVRDVLQPFQQFAKEAFSRVFISPFLYEDIQYVTILIHSPPQVVVSTSNPDTQLIQVPRISQPPLSLPQFHRKRLPEFPTPLAHSVMAHSNPAPI